MFVRISSVRFNTTHYMHSSHVHARASMCSMCIICSTIVGRSSIENVCGKTVGKGSVRVTEVHIVCYEMFEHIRYWKNGTCRPGTARPYIEYAQCCAAILHNVILSSF